MDLNLTLCYFLIRFVIPITLGAVVFLRQNLFSFVYLILLFVGPLLPKPNSENVLRGCNGIYLKTIIVLSALINSAHLIFQVILLIVTDYASSIDYCSILGQLYSMIGLHRYNDLSVWNIVRLCCLDFVVLLITCMVFAFCCRAYDSRSARTLSRENLNRSETRRRMTEACLSVESTSSTAARQVHERSQQLSKKRLMKEKADRLTYYLVESIFCMLLCTSALLEPSLVSAVYFLYFLFIGSWFALNRSFSKGYHYFRIFIALFVAVHLVVLFAYQFIIFQPIVPPGNINARLFGLVEYLNVTCTNAREFQFHSYHFVRFMHPFALLFLYFVSVNLIYSVLVSKKYLLQADAAGPPCSPSVYFSFPSIPSESRPSNGFLSNLLHNASSNFKRNSRVNSMEESVNILGPSHALTGHNQRPLVMGNNKKDRMSVDKECVTESLHVNRTYDSRATVCTTDATPLLQDDKMGRSYNSTAPTGQLASTSKLAPAEESTSSRLESFSNRHSSISACTPSAPNTPNYAFPIANQPTENEFSLFFSQLVNMIKRGSYVITLIVMMTWSITYHSWLSFIFLLSSCIIWMMPNSRQACLSSSPVVVAYAILLLIGQYVYSLNLDDQELPIVAGSVSISEIGFRKYGEFSYQPLFIKICYTLFFWITLRQHTEKLANKRQFSMAQGVLPPIFNFGTNAPHSSSLAEQSRQFSIVPMQSSYKSESFNWLMKFFQGLLIKYWIWVVAGMLMVMSLSGSKVVIYRIVYMFLFLTFTIMFQLSLKWWRKLMYPFWLIVILYSMLILIAIYTYQFNNFPIYWENYLRINKELQEDLGLVVYDNDAFVLFRELLTPTFFIIITIIQVHFVHKDFSADILEHVEMRDKNPDEQSNIISPQVESDANNEQQPSSNQSLDRSEVKVDIDLSQSEMSSMQTVISKKPQPSTSAPTSKPIQRKMSSGSEVHSKDTPEKTSFMKEVCELLQKTFDRMQSILSIFMVIFWRLMEIHVLKFVLLCAIIISVKDISVMNIVFVFLSVFLMVFSKFEKVVCFLFGIWAGVLVLLKMLFQLNIAQQIEWGTNCTGDHINGTKEIDNRVYIGFLRTNDIFQYIIEYIFLIIILVFRSVILLRQRRYRREEYGSVKLLEGVVFPDVDRNAAEVDFMHFVKYMINFGFYKFGVEICLILLTISITNRKDIFSVLYCVWLLLFILLNRQGNEKMWNYFIGFLAIVLPYQYLMCLGIPPGLCLSYPWTEYLPKSEREWYFLPDFDNPLPKNKLSLDFLVLFFSCRQLIGFKLEKVLAPTAGNNLEARKGKPDYIVRDFFSFGNSIFDSIKSFFFFCFFWITLAIMFLAGTTRINLFGLGYLLGSFLFLWMGNEFYLKPDKVIFKAWRSILAYTCITMLLKSIMQLFVTGMLHLNLCWIIQLLGINYYEKTLLSKQELNLVSKCITNESGLLWDCVCFTFLLIQKRIFCSHYFKHLVREIKAQHFLASRGAELIHEIQAKEVAEQELAEREVMEKIKQKMDRIKAAQKRMFADKARSIKYHKQAVKSGGYYMFEDLDSDVVDLNNKTRESLIPDPEGNEMRNLAKSKGFTAFCSKIFKGEEISEASLVSAETAELGESSKDSAIVSVERPKYHPDMSRPTTLTTLASTSQPTSLSSAMSSLTSGSKEVEQEAEDKPVDQALDEENYLNDKPKQFPEETYLQKISSWFNFIKNFLESILISATSSLNSVSRDYRFVAKRLSVEKKCLKKVIELEESIDNSYDYISDQAWKKTTLSKLSRVNEDTLENLVKSEPQLAMQQWNQLDLVPNESDHNLYYVTLDAKYLESSIYLRFVQAIFYAILSRSEVMCYITIVVNQLFTASILSLPLPLLAYLWGSLSVPRPSKSFWVTCITYIELLVVTKYIFQFQFWPWLDGSVKLSPFWWPRLVGIEKKDNYATYDLFLLLVLFFHRFMLKSLGLWDLSETEIKAYMTNAELMQNEIDQKELQLNGDGKKNKNSKRKQKSKANKMNKPSFEGEEKLDLKATEDMEEQISKSSIATKDKELLIQEDNTSDDSDYESSEFNAIYFLMKAPTYLKQKLKQTVKPVIKFFHNVLHPPYRITHDVYSLMFLCDFINFFILVFGFYAFGSGYSDAGGADVARFLEENRIPIGFLITLLIQFAQIIVDRAIYLRKYIKGKLIFQIIIVIFTHIWLFFILPAMTDVSFVAKDNLPPKLWYIFKCIYFLLSAYQIRSGYPTRILGNTFCKKYNFVNWYLFKMYMMIPFVYDLRMYMDWIWTDTSLVLDEWSLMEDIFVNLYQRKCELKLDEEFPEPRGKPKKRFFKYLIGGTWVVIIIALIWGPLGLFAFGRAVGEENAPIGATFELEISGFQPLFKMSVTGSGLERIEDRDWASLLENFKTNAVAQTFISGYDQSDVYMVNLNGNSTAVWGISPPSQRILVDQLRNNETMHMKITYSIMRKKRTKTQDMDTTIYDEHLVELSDWALRQKLADMISQPDERTQAVVSHIFPNYLRAPEKGKPMEIFELLPRNATTNSNYRNIQVMVKQGNYENNSLTSWWEIHDDCKNITYLDKFMQDLLTQKCQYLPVVLFNDKVFIGLLAFLSGYGIIGIYTTFVFLVSRWVRGLNSESSFKVIYTRMPNVDRVLQLCLDIYLVRESREFELEEDLYAKLIFLYRSPETLIKWTKTNEEIAVTQPIAQYRTN